MSQSPQPSGSASDRGGKPGTGDPPGDGADPWAAFGLIAAGVLFYGAIGWALAAWLHARILIAVGIVFGAGLGLWSVYWRYGRITDHARHTTGADDDG